MKPNFCTVTKPVSNNGVHKPNETNDFNRVVYVGNAWNVLELFDSTTRSCHKWQELIKYSRAFESNDSHDSQQEQCVSTDRPNGTYMLGFLKMCVMSLSFRIDLLLCAELDIPWQTELKASHHLTIRSRTVFAELLSWRVRDTSTILGPGSSSSSSTA